MQRLKVYFPKQLPMGKSRVLYFHKAADKSQSNDGDHAVDLTLSERDTTMSRFQSAVTFHRLAFVAVALLASIALAAEQQGNATLEFELITEQGSPIGSAQQWLELFARLDQTSIRIRQSRGDEQESVNNLGTEGKPIYHVVGVLTTRNRLRLPGGEFGVSDRARIGDWIKQLQTHGIGGPKKTTVFGLTDEELVAFHDRLAVPITCETRGRRAGDVARDIVNGIGMEYSVSITARDAFSGQLRLEDDLRKLSSGTALAAAIRPLGLVFRPEKAASGSLRLMIYEVRETDESWPIGWPPDQIPSKVAPKLFDYLKVTISSRSLSDAMAAIEPRVQVPFLLDHNSLVRNRIEPAAIKVSYSKDRAMYKKVLDNLFFQAGLTSELRVDEAGQGFLWISAR